MPAPALPDWNAWQAAAAAGDLAAVTAWLDAGVPVGAEVSGCSLLRLAATYKRVELARLLLARGADPSSELTSAACHGSARVVRLLLQAGARVEARGPNVVGRPLALAAWQGHAPVVKLLLAAGADPRAYDVGDTALTLCAKGGDSRGHVECVRLLLAAGADPARRDARDCTAAQIARIHGHAQVAAALRGARRRTAP